MQDDSFDRVKILEQSSDFKCKNSHAMELKIQNSYSIKFKFKNSYVMEFLNKQSIEFKSKNKHLDEPQFKSIHSTPTYSQFDQAIFLILWIGGEECSKSK